MFIHGLDVRQIGRTPLMEVITEIDFLVYQCVSIIALFIPSVMDIITLMFLCYKCCFYKNRTLWQMALDKQK